MRGAGSAAGTGAPGSPRPALAPHSPVAARAPPSADPAPPPPPTEAPPGPAGRAAGWEHEGVPDPGPRSRRAGRSAAHGRPLSWGRSYDLRGASGGRQGAGAGPPGAHAAPGPGCPLCPACAPAGSGAPRPPALPLRAGPRRRCPRALSEPRRGPRARAGSGRHSRGAAAARAEQDPRAAGTLRGSRTRPRPRRPSPVRGLRVPGARWPQERPPGPRARGKAGAGRPAAPSSRRRGPGVALVRCPDPGAVGTRCFRPRPGREPASARGFQSSAERCGGAWPRPLWPPARSPGARPRTRRCGRSGASGRQIPTEGRRRDGLGGLRETCRSGGNRPPRTGPAERPAGCRQSQRLSYILSMRARADPHGAGPGADWVSGARGRPGATRPRGWA